MGDTAGLQQYLTLGKPLNGFVVKTDLATCARLLAIGITAYE